jgi:formylglycine-generating enzyme required for sulfatase activity
MTLLKYCVIRGGAWYQALYGKEYTLASYRGPQDARKDSSGVGFRTTLAARRPR